MLENSIQFSRSYFNKETFSKADKHCKTFAYFCNIRHSKPLNEHRNTCFSYREKNHKNDLEDKTPPVGGQLVIGRSVNLVVWWTEINISAFFTSNASRSSRWNPLSKCMPFKELNAMKKLTNSLPNQLWTSSDNTQPTFLEK